MPAKKKPLFSKRKRVIAVIVAPLAIVALILFSAIQLFRISGLESSVQSLTEQNFLTTTNSSQQSLVVDGPSKKVYIPEMNLILPYDAYLTSQFVYSVDQSDKLVSEGTVLFYDKFELMSATSTPDGLKMDGCRQATQLVIGADSGVPGSELVSRRVLQDGRHAAIYKSTDSSCKAFLGSTDASAMIDMLQHAESY